MLIQSSILSSNPVTLPDTVVLLSETESEIRKIQNFSKSIKIVDFASKIPKFVQLLVQILLKIHRNLDESPLKNLHRDGCRFWPNFKSRYLRDYLVFFVQIFFIAKPWIYSIDSARFRHFPRCLEKYVIIPTHINTGTANTRSVR